MLTNGVNSCIRNPSKQESRGKRDQPAAGATSSVHEGLGLSGERSTGDCSGSRNEQVKCALLCMGAEKGGLHQFRASRW